MGSYFSITIFFITFNVFAAFANKTTLISGETARNLFSAMVNLGVDVEVSNDKRSFSVDQLSCYAFGFDEPSCSFIQWGRAITSEGKSSQNVLFSLVNAGVASRIEPGFVETREIRLTCTSSAFSDQETECRY